MYTQSTTGVPNYYSNQPNSPNNYIDPFGQTIATQVNTRTVTPIDHIFGAPPGDYGEMLGTELKISQNNLVILHIITVGELAYKGGSSSIVNAFDITPKIGEFQNYVSSISGLSITSGFPIKFSLQNPVLNQSMTNEYAQSVLESSVNFVGDMLKDYTYLTGQSSKNFGNMIDSTFGGLSAQLGSMVNSIKGILPSNLKNAIQGNTVGQQVSSGLSALNKAAGNSTVGQVLKGYRIDVPMVWKGSSTNKSFSAKIKLYAIADNRESIERNIILPYTILKVLSAPRSDQGNFLYKWPFIMEIKVPGIVHLPMCAITSANFNKPGQGEVYTHTGKYLNIDVDVTFTPLYNTEFTVNGSTAGSRMLTVNDDVESLKELLLS